MKNILFSLFVILAFSVSNAQESLIADIMQVDAVTVSESEKFQEALEEYQSKYDQGLVKLDENLTSLGEDYQKNVQSLIQGFTKVLNDAVEQEVKNEKRSVITQTTTLTMTLKAEKKKAIQNFQNEMEIAIRDLPDTFREDKSKELKDAIDERVKNAEAEYEANQKVIAAFKNTEHLIKTNEPVSPPNQD